MATGAVGWRRTPGGTVTVVVIEVTDGVLVEVVDDGSADTPVVKGSWCTAGGQGLFLVEQLAARCGFLRDPAGTTVWFHLKAAQPDNACQADVPDGYLVVTAATAASTPAQMAATSSSLLT